MASEPSRSDKFDIRAGATALLRFSPILLVGIYIFEYNYVFQFLSQFGVTPEEAGVSEIKLLTRAASFTLSFAYIIAFVFAGAGAYISAIRRSRMTGQPLSIVAFVNFTREPPSSRDRSTIAAAKSDSETEQVTRISVTLIFIIVFVATLFLWQSISSPYLPLIVMFASMVILISAGLYTRWRTARVRYMILATGVLFCVGFLAAASFTGGIQNGYTAATTGRVPGFIGSLGVDVLQVHPEWVNNGIVPAGYVMDQDMLKLGSDAGAVFLYDCRARVTYTIPVGDVVLTYALPFDQASSEMIRRLHCRPT